MKIKTREFEINVDKCEVYVPRMIKGKLYTITLQTNGDYKQLLVKLSNLLQTNDEMFLLVYNTFNKTKEN